MMPIAHPVDWWEDVMRTQGQDNKAWPHTLLQHNYAHYANHLQWAIIIWFFLCACKCRIKKNALYVLILWLDGPDRWICGPSRRSFSNSFNHTRENWPWDQKDWLLSPVTANRRTNEISPLIVTRWSTAQQDAKSVCELGREEADWTERHIETTVRKGHCTLYTTWGTLSSPHQKKKKSVLLLRWEDKV